MRVVVHLPSPVPAFQPTSEQLSTLRARVPEHEITGVHTDSELVAALPWADAAVVWQFRPELYARAPRLRHLFTPAAGHEAFEPDPRGRVQWHFGRFHGLIMAESLLAMITFMNRRIGVALRAQAERRWDRAPYSRCRRLRGQVVLLIGFGAIGQHCGRLLSALGMVVHAVRRDLQQPSPGAERVFTREQRLEALEGADHVVCVLPGDTETDGLLDAQAFSCMKASACVYNLGRGNAIDADALCSALSSARIAGAFLDVLPEEPLPPSSPLWAMPNLYLTPHASAINAEYLDLYFEELGEELMKLS
jgi:phosphoglycerate dehydrogenase-like enzyme